MDAEAIEHASKGKLPQQCHGSLAAAFAATQIYVNHKDAFLLQQQGGVWTRRLIRQHA
jgi:hypothetical protein